MSDEQLTSALVEPAMRWRLAPGRYLKPGGGWTSRSGFRPLVDVNDAFRAPTRDDRRVDRAERPQRSAVFSRYRENNHSIHQQLAECRFEW